MSINHASVPIEPAPEIDAHALTRLRLIVLRRIGRPPVLRFIAFRRRDERWNLIAGIEEIVEPAVLVDAEDDFHNLSNNLIILDFSISNIKMVRLPSYIASHFILRYYSGFHDPAIMNFARYH